MAKLTRAATLFSDTVYEKLPGDCDQTLNKYNLVKENFALVQSYEM